MTVDNHGHPRIDSVLRVLIILHQLICFITSNEVQGSAWWEELVQWNCYLSTIPKELIKSANSIVQKLLTLPRFEAGPSRIQAIHVTAEVIVLSQSTYYIRFFFDRFHPQPWYWHWSERLRHINWMKLLKNM